MDEGMLSDIARRRLAALLLIAGALLGALAIADAGPFGDPPAPEELVEQTASDFYAAAAAGDFERYCELLTETARSFIVTADARAEAREAGGVKRSCAEVVMNRIGDALAETQARIRQVSVSGNRARVEVDLKLPGEEFPQPRTVMLEQDERKDWRISDPG